ncbi:MFS transporter [Aquipseudomonas guryensis]|uniref:MFS transporter n=1 Tax=Aquipseudomonas guryensis TaxID=2759165 RepID=A0A7W4H4F4_9GAMM|nr:MFS transporter [Pseudomonas guryensis]MBB1519267.1 MFS transporter [Pseudomonas guryensis]
MTSIWKSFRSLYFATLLMLIGSGLLSTYLGLRLAADKVDTAWIGALMAANYLGLVLGGKVGHRLIARVGHMRAFVSSSGVVGAAVLGHGLIDWLPAWLLLRALVGLGMMCQYMVIESWLNEQAQASQRGRVFSGYMIACYLGLMLGQLTLVLHPALGLELLMLVALCFTLCLVPVAMTRRSHPAPMQPVALEPMFFIRRVPQSLTTILVSGLAIGSFYGLAPLHASLMGLSTLQVGLFMASCILAGLLVQWPLGWLSDRYDRGALIRNCAVLLTLASLPLAILTELPLELLFPLGFVFCLLQFSLYPLAVAFSNDYVEAEHRVSLTAMLLVTFGIGACLGPLSAGLLMRELGPNMLYAFVSFCAFILIFRVRPDTIKNMQPVENAPLQHVVVPDNMTSSPLSAALDPRVEERTVHEQMQRANPAPEAGDQSAP